MSTQVIRGRFPEPSIRPDMTKVRKVLDSVNGDDAGALYVAALGGFTGADLGRQQGNHQLLIDGLAVAFFAIAGIFGIPREQAEGYLPPQAG
jgi:outer membrane lipoprotein SlyB